MAKGNIHPEKTLFEIEKIGMRFFLQFHRYFKILFFFSNQKQCKHG